MLNANDNLELSPEGKTIVNAKLPINNCSFVCYSTWVSYWLSRSLGAPMPWVKVSKVRVLNVVSKPFTH